MIWFSAVKAQVVVVTTLFLSFIQWWSDTAAKYNKSIIADDCGDHSCEQCWAGNRLDHWSGNRGSWWVTECEETNIVAVSKLLIIRCTAERKDMFHIHNLIADSNVKFVYKVYFNYKFNEFKNHS